VVGIPLPWPRLSEKTGQVDEPRIRKSLYFNQNLKNQERIFEGLNTWLVKAKAMVAGLKWLASFADQGKGNAGRFLKWTGAETCPEKK